MQVYPEASSPKIANGEYCVLCHQDLEGDAKRRLQRFEEFIEGNFQRIANKKKDDFEALKKSITSLVPLNLETTNQQFELFESLHKSESQRILKITSAIKVVDMRQRAVLGALDSMDFDKLEQLINQSFLMEGNLSSICDEIISAINHLIANKGEEFFLKEQGRIDALEYKKAIDIEKVNKQFDLLTKIKILESCDKQFNSRPITDQSTSRAGDLIKGIKDIYMEEVRQLKLSYLKVSVEAKGEKGETKVEVDANLMRSSLRDVLSEGEQRAIALAGFLTEVNERDRGHAIILDDPVSSLDWDRRKLIARRLMREASRRQIILFTHDISFALLIEYLCKDHKINCETLWIMREEKERKLKFGITGESAVAWETKNVKQRLKEIKKEIDQMKEDEDKNGAIIPNDELILTAKRLRDTWERAVEEIVFNGSIQRFLPSVQTTRLKRVCFDGASSDYDQLYKGMSLISDPLHDGSENAGSAPITTSDLENNYELLKNWTDMLKNRRDGK